ncbi:MAG: TRAP transporter small permease [Chloroflexi bacterium]|nr:TRAP transporter small permease [Chloroflexota bacterium]
MKRLSRIWWSIFDGIIDRLALLGGILLAFVMLLVVAEVIMRYLVGQSIRWEFEVTEYSLVFMTFLATAWVLKEEGHVILDLLVERLRPKPKAMANTITSIVGALVCLALAWYGISTTLEFYRLDVRQPSTFNPPSFILYIIIPIGSFLLFLQFLRRAYNHLGIWRTS